MLAVKHFKCIRSYTYKYKSVPVSVYCWKIKPVLVTNISASEWYNVHKLEIPVTEEKEHSMLNVPARRPDITISEDLVEEVGRLYGYDHIPVNIPSRERWLDW